MECVGKYHNDEGKSLMQLALINTGTAKVKRPIREKLICELHKLGMPRYEKGEVNFIENDTSTLNLRQTILHVKNKLLEYFNHELSFTEFFC